MYAFRRNCPESKTNISRTHPDVTSPTLQLPHHLPKSHTPPLSPFPSTSYLYAPLSASASDSYPSGQTTVGQRQTRSYQREDALIGIILDTLRKFSLHVRVVRMFHLSSSNM